MVAVAARPLPLSPEQWRARAAAHEARVRQWTEPHQERARRGEKHPVWDFLFEYYSFRPAQLRRWHPGPGVELEGAAAAPALTEKRRVFVGWLLNFLQCVSARPGFFGCYGMHEWAMVYRCEAREVRHPALPLRLSPSELATVVESAPLRCSHFDAFRFFTASARPLNALQPERAAVARFEQRGCLHANMDLYKWAFKLAPYGPSELTADCFELARDIREADMRASPYDLTALGFEPIPVETREGRAEYERHQRAFAARAEPLRERLIGACRELLRPR
jgi:hypothetical protein